MRQLFLDLDGVLADFDSFYESEFGYRPNRNNPDPPDLWANINGHKNFYGSLPLMPDAMELWNGVKQYHPSPIILTGVPRNKKAEPQKREWVRKHFGADVKVITCYSRLKCTYAQPGDVLVDDWEKYRHLWENVGGVFILHRNASQSLSELGVLFK